MVLDELMVGQSSHSKQDTHLEGEERDDKGLALGSFSSFFLYLASMLHTYKHGFS